MASTDSTEESQHARVRETLQYARAHVPYYRDNGGSPADLSSWPVLDKATVAASPRSFQSEETRRERLLHFQSRGTTGTPLTVICDPQAYQTEMAFRWRHRAWAGIAFGSRAAYVAGHQVIPAGRRRPPFWVFDRCENRMLFSSYHIGELTLPHYLRALERFNPDLLHGYPSSLFLLANAALRTKSFIRPRAIITASETLLEHQRAAIERAFGTKVYNWYGQTELTCNIVECREGRLHTRPDYGVLEVLSDGTMVATGLNNMAMPLIRYRTGDRARLGEGCCSCGCRFPLVEAIEGRSEDYIVTPEGFAVGRLDHIFKGVRGVLEAQVVQPNLNTIVLRIVRGEEYARGAEEHIRSEARGRLGELMSIRFEYVPVIERAPGGKFRFIVSHLAGSSGRERVVGALEE